MAAALLGMLLELEGYEPAFPRDGERPEAALSRVRPLLVVLADEALDVSRSDLFLARAARRNVAVLLFGAADRSDGPPAWARERRLPWFRMPVDGRQLREAIDTSTAGLRLWRTGTDRRQPRTETGADGTLIYHDRAGRRWHIYDRRRTDRRQRGARSFVNDAGEEWRVELTAADFLDESPTGLERQLARAAPVRPA